MQTLDQPPNRAKRLALAAAACCALAAPIVTRFEGRVTHTYPDVVYGWKVPTACDGHTGPEVRAGQTFTDAQCETMLHQDLTKEFDGLAKCMPLDAPTHELAAYLDLAHNIGPAAVCRSSIPRKLKAGQHAAACATISEFKFVGGRDCSLPKYARACGGIIWRRAVERSLCEGLLTPSSTAITLAQ